MNELTDLAICKRIAEIESVCARMMKSALAWDKKLMYMPETHDGHREYNPLKDDALCFRLMVKYRIELFEVDNTWHCSWAGSNLVTKNKSPNKAICLAIIGGT